MSARGASGAWVSIEDAASGGGQGLSCACGAELIGRKGDERAHHFAHASGSSKGCEVARTTAIGEFVTKAVTERGSIELPPRRYSSEQPNVVVSGYEVRNGVVVAHLDHASGVVLDVVVAVRLRDERQARKDDWIESARSTMLVSLVKCNAVSDRELVEAVVSGAPREWLADRKPERGKGRSVLRYQRPGIDPVSRDEPAMAVARTVGPAYEVCEPPAGSGPVLNQEPMCSAVATGRPLKGRSLPENYKELLEAMFPAADERARLAMKYGRGHNRKR